MAWEYRHHRAQRYYYRTHRVGSRRIRVYLGCGPIAELAATIDQLRQIEHELGRRELRGDPPSRRQSPAAQETAHGESNPDSAAD